MGWKETWNRRCPWHFAFESKNVDGNEKDTYFYVLNNMLGETCDVLTDTIDFLNDEMIGY